MSQPIVNFADRPPLNVDCSNPTAVVVTVMPGSIGTCTVTLALNRNFKACSFNNGQKALTRTVVANDATSLFDCSFDVQMDCSPEDVFITLFIASAVNANGEKSYIKPIEVIISP
jgi:hypothetical protein